MTAPDSRTKRSDYLVWAKRRPGARYNLARSGAPRLPLASLGPSLEDLLTTDACEDGWPPILERLAARYGVTPAHIVTTQGCSLANHLAYATVLDPGDEVLLETPVYEPLVALARYLGARAAFVPRREDNAWRIDPDDVRRALTPRTRLVVLSNLHNPTGAFTDDAALAEIAHAAQAVGAHVLVDEVYLDFVYGEGVRTAARLAPNVLATRSLTKAFGLDTLRVGWVIAEPALAERVRRLNDLFSVNSAHPGERLARLALDQADRILPAINRELERGIRSVDAFVRAQERLAWVAPRAGTVGLVRARGIDVDALVERLHREHEVAVVPGRFFAAAESFRISWTVDDATLESALGRIALALR